MSSTLNRGRYAPLDEAPDHDECRSCASSDAGLGSQNALNDPPDRHEIWDQPWWLFLLMVLLFLGLVAASIGVHAVVCNEKRAFVGPITTSTYTKLAFRWQATPAQMGFEADTTTCMMERILVDGSGPAWRPASLKAMDIVSFGDDRLLALAVANALNESINIQVESILGGKDVFVESNRERLVRVPQPNLVLEQLGAGTLMLEPQGGFLRGQGLAVPLIIEGGLPNIGSDYDVDLIGAIDRASDVVVVLQDSCPVVHRNVTFGSCSCESQGTFSDVSNFAFGSVSANNNFESNVFDVVVDPGDTVRLRLYNGASGTNFCLNVTNEDNIVIKSTIVAIDSSWIAPVDLDALTEPLWIGIGQRLDIILFVPNRRWTTITLTAIEEGDLTGRQLGVRLLSEQSMENSEGRFPLSRLTATGRFESWGNEQFFRRPVSVARSDDDDSIEVYLSQAKSPSPSSKPTPFPHRNISFTMLLGENNTINGRWGGLQPTGSNTLKVVLGSHVVITFVNMASMPLPMRIYGHTFTMTRLDGAQITSGIRRETVLIPPAHNVTVSFSALNPGVFPVACMHELRRARGMIAFIDYVIS